MRAKSLHGAEATQAPFPFLALSHCNVFLQNLEQPLMQNYTQHPLFNPPALRVCPFLLYALPVKPNTPPPFTLPEPEQHRIQSTSPVQISPQQLEITFLTQKPHILGNRKIKLWVHTHLLNCFSLPCRSGLRTSVANGRKIS